MATLFTEIVIYIKSQFWRCSYKKKVFYFQKPFWSNKQTRPEKPENSLSGGYLSSLILSPRSYRPRSSPLRHFVDVEDWIHFVTTRSALFFPSPPFHAAGRLWFVSPHYPFIFTFSFPHHPLCLAFSFPIDETCWNSDAWNFPPVFHLSLPSRAKAKNT